MVVNISEKNIGGFPDKSRRFLNETAAAIFWFIVIVLGITLVGPKDGYTKSIVLDKNLFKFK